MGKEVKFKCPHCGSNHVEECWQTNKYILLCEECNTIAEFPVTSSEDVNRLFDLEYNEWVEHEWPEYTYTATCSDGCCDINLPDEEEKEADDTETKCDMGYGEFDPEWYKDEVIRLDKVVRDQELIIECLLDKIRYERNR